MQAVNLKPVPLLAVLMAALIALAGCVDSLSSQDDGVPAPPAAPSKMRHAHLFDAGDGAGKILERYAELMASTEFVVGASGTVLDLNHLVERYEDEPGVTVKRVFKKVYKGFAMHVDPLHVGTILAKIELDDDVAWIEPDPHVNFNPEQGTNDKAKNSQNVPFTLGCVGADESSTASGDGTGAVGGVEVYVLDTGLAHSDLDVAEQLNFADDPMDGAAVWDHGTHVAGTLAAIDDAADVVGVAPGARVHNLRVLNNNGQAELSAAIAAVEHVTEQKAADPATPIVVNISFGADVGATAYNALDQAIAASIAQGVVYVIAAGNGGIDAATVTPAHVQEAITVGAYECDSGHKAKWVDYSNYGAGVDLHAPGHNVKSLGWSTSSPLKMSGTSMAAPHVAGAAALYLSQNPAATPQEVRDALVNAADASVQGVPEGTTDKSVWVGDF